MMRARVTGGKAASIGSVYRLVDPALHENQIEPAIELMAHLAQVSGLLEAEAFVEADRGLISGIHAGDHHVLAQGRGTREQRLHKVLADAPATRLGADV